MKRGEITMSFTTQVLLGVVGSALLIMLGFKLLSPGYNPSEVGAEAYIDNLKENIYLADKQMDAVFQMPSNGKEDLNYYLVYFGNAVNLKVGIIDSFFSERVSFSYSGRKAENTVCICYWDGNIVFCNSCFNLEKPAVIQAKSSSDLIVEGGDFWIAKEGVEFEIKGGSEYVFSER